MTDTPLEIELLGSVKIRPARAEDEAQLLQLRQALCPETSSAEHLSDIRGLLSGKPRSTLPLVIYVAESRGALLGFVEVGLRSPTVLLLATGHRVISYSKPMGTRSS